MRRLVKTVAAFASAALVAGTFALASADPASAAGPPPWEPDAGSVGALVFFNAAGQQVTGGNLSDAPVAAYVQGTSAVRSGDTKATLFGYLPVNGQVPGQWSGEALSASTTYPNASAPGTLGSSALPLVTGSAGDESISQLAADFPNTDTSTDGYKGMYQLRLKTSATGRSTTSSYDSADIQISGSTWSVVYPSPTPPPPPAGTTCQVNPTTGVYVNCVAVTYTATGLPAVGLHISGSNSITVTGTNWAPGHTVVTSVCNADAALQDPTAQFLAGGGTGSTTKVSTSDACAPVAKTGTTSNIRTVNGSGGWSWTTKLIAGQQGNSTNSQCSQTRAQAANGVACILGAADITNSTSGFQALYFQQTPMTITQRYQSGLLYAGQWSVKFSTSNGHGVSIYAPNGNVSKQIPNYGGYATTGVICSNSDYATAGCNVEYQSDGVTPVPCQASSNSSATTPWGGQTACSFGAAGGEPIAIEATAYTAPSADPSLASAVPLNTPLDCTTSGCAVTSQAGSGSANPGSFGSYTLAYNLTPGSYTFAASGVSSTQVLVTKIVLGPGPKAS